METYSRRGIFLDAIADGETCKLEPVTREEVMLKRLVECGGAGKLPFGETTTVKEVLAECQPMFVEGDGQFYLLDAPSLNEGETYIVNWNGTDYKCVTCFVEDAGDLVFFGNLSKIGAGADTGEPFWANVWYHDGDDMNVMSISPLDGSTTLTISIRQEVITVQKMSGKYVEGMGYEEDGVVHPIDQKFLPSGTLYTAFYDEREISGIHSNLTTANGDNVDYETAVNAGDFVKIICTAYDPPKEFFPIWKQVGDTEVQYGVWDGKNMNTYHCSDSSGGAPV